MQNFAKRTLSILMVAFMLLSVFAGIVPMHNHVHAAGSFASVGGWNETIYAKISGISDSQVTGVSYSGPVSGSLTGEDLEYLVRDEDGYTRIDVLGLPAGTYTLTVNTTSGDLTQGGIVVPAQDRSGYAHFNDTEGVGAYTNTGTLKSNAIVLYVTDSNKNTVTVTSKDGTTVSGIGNILGSTGMDVGTGLNSKGGAANTNSDILRKLAADGTPLVIRIIGSVKGASSTNMSSATSEIDGLTQYDGTDYGGTVGDNGFMARMSGGKNITIEGVGYGATIDGWGIHFICQTDDYAAGYGRSFEVRNLTFKNVPEDCVGMEGQQDGSTLTAPVERCWVHNCSFIAPSISSPAESDKDGGDGACDFKRGNYMTMSYCYYEGYHKTNLVGSSDSALQYHITWHHNYWKGCDSRGPLGRNANMHIYNCVYEGQTSYAMNPRANCYIFSEYNMFINCKNPVAVDSGAVKSYNDSFSSCTGDNNATIVSDKSTQVSTSNTYANFDTNSDLSYIPSGNYALQESLTDMKAEVLANAGAQKETVVSSEDVDLSVIPDSKKPTAAVVLPYSESLNKTYISANGTVDNIVFNVAKFNTDSLTVGSNTDGCDIVFYVDRTVKISMTEVSGTYSPVLCNEAGVAIITGSGEATDLPAGYYFIQSGGYDVGSSKYKEAKVASLSIEAVVVHGDNDHVYTASKVVAPTCTEGGYTVYECSCGATKNDDVTAATGHTAGAAATCLAAQTCTACGTQLAAALGHSYSSGKCSRCGAIDPSSCAHGDTVIQNAKDATCSAEGYTGDTFCNTCQTVTQTGSTIAKLAHTGGAAATCTAAQTCTVCGATVTAALGHNYVDGVCSRCGAEDLAASGYIHNFTENGTTSTFYTITGNTSTSKGSVTYEGLTLTTCLKIESSTNISFNAPSAGTLTLVFGGSTSASGKAIKIDGTATDIDSTQVLTVDVAAGSHTVTKGDSINLFYMVYAPAGSACAHSNTTTSTVDATCNTAGSTTVTCSDCGVVVSTTAIPATGNHTAGAAATCVKDQTCTVCGTVLASATGNHTYVSGVCSVCGLVDPSSCAHTNTTTTTVDATCTVAGSTTVTCDACGETISTETIAATGHTEVTVSGTAATCTAAGLTEGKKCSVCGVTTVAQQTIAALGHNYSNGICTRCGAEETALTVGGWFEAAWAEWAPVAGASGYNVYYKAESGNWTQIDAELIREYGDYWRADVVGLKAGKYQLCVAPVISGSTGTHMHSDLVTVMAHDRSGYGFVSGASLKGGQTVSTSSGAYNDDGTLKSNAVVVYVTNDNKDSVTATIGGSSYTGITNILAASVIKTMSTPLCIRLIGNITDPTGGGAAFDKGDLLIDNNGNSVGLTIEGIGEDATCNGFGIRLKNSSNVEIRNLAIMNCDSSEGDNIGIQQTCDHIWVHNCDFFYGHAGSDADQVKGDGALDTKKSEYVTHSYNHFWDCGKCNLQGGSTSDTSDNITYHHNWYDHSDSRHPRVRVATVHVYNNYYDGVSKYGIGNAYKAEVISECNYFRNTKNPMLTSTKGSDEGVNTMSGETPGTLTSYNDYVVGATSWIPNVDGIQGATSWSADNYDCVIVDTTYTAYSYNLQTAEEAKTQVENYAGRMNHGDFTWDFDDSVEDTNYEVITELKSALGAYDDSIVSVGGSSVTEEHINCAHSNTTTTTTPATCGQAGSTVVKCADCNAVVSTTTIPATGNHTAGSAATCVDAQTCTVCGTVLNAATGNHNYVDGTCTVCGKTDAATCGHSNTTTTTVDATCTAAGSETVTCDACGTVISTVTIPATGHTAGADATCTEAQTCTVCQATITAALGHNYVDGVCSRCGAEDLAASGYIHNFTENGTTSTFYTITGNLSTKYGTVTYNGLTLTQCLKIESSTNISFTAPSDGTLTLVFVETATNIKLDGTKVTASSNVMTLDITAGSHTLTKADTMNLFYMVYTPASSGGDVHTHSYTSAVTKVPTCTAEGVRTYTCSCGDTYTETISVAAHTEVVDAAVAATCTATGLTEGKHCSVCNEVLVAQTTVAALGHTEVVDAAVAATCTTAGKTEGKHCSVCNEILVAQTEVVATGHTEVVDAAVAATCTAAGKTEGKHCSVCNEVLVAQTEVAATGHTPGAAADCTNAQTCTVCQAVITAALGHQEKVVAGEAASCTETGLTDGIICERCDAILDAQEEIPALGHSNAAAVKENEQAATCTVDGSYDSVVYCSTCGAEVSRETVTVKAEGHKEVVDAAVAATCTTAGKTEGKHCSVCNEVLVAQTVVDALGHNYENGACSRCGASDPDVVAGVTVSGTYTSFTSGDSASKVVTIELILEGQTEAAYSFVSDGTADSGTWSIEGVAPGTYTVKVSKEDHVTREYDLTVGEENVTDMNVEIWLLGDMNGDGLANAVDYGNVLRQVKFSDQPILTDYNRQCADIDADGDIDFWDYLNILWHMKGTKSLW